MGTFETGTRAASGILNLSRRTFLKGSGGLALGIAFAPLLRGGEALAATAEPFTPNAFVRIAGDGSVTILAGQTSAAVTLSILNDTLIEENETLTLSLTGLTANSPGVSLQAGATQATSTIADNDTALLRIAATTNAAEAGSVAGVFTITASTTPPVVCSGAGPTLSARFACQGLTFQSFTVELEEPLSRFWWLAERPIPNVWASLA